MLMAAELDGSFRCVKSNGASKNVHITQKCNLCVKVFIKLAYSLPLEV